jgi:hypothetical protein
MQDLLLCSKAQVQNGADVVKLKSASMTDLTAVADNLEQKVILCVNRFLHQLIKVWALAECKRAALILCEVDSESNQFRLAPQIRDSHEPPMDDLDCLRECEE